MNSGRKTYRRKRKYQGASWTPERSSALTDDGIWCPRCKQRHGYKSQLVGLNYEKRNGVWYILWHCKKTGNVIKEQGLVRKNV